MSNNGMGTPQAPFGDANGNEEDFIAALVSPLEAKGITGITQAELLETLGNARTGFNEGFTDIALAVAKTPMAAEIQKFFLTAQAMQGVPNSRSDQDIPVLIESLRRAEGALFWIREAVLPGAANAVKQRNLDSSTGLTRAEQGVLQKLLPSIVTGSDQLGSPPQQYPLADQLERVTLPLYRDLLERIQAGFVHMRSDLKKSTEEVAPSAGQNAALPNKAMAAAVCEIASERAFALAEQCLQRLVEPAAATSRVRR